MHSSDRSSGAAMTATISVRIVVLQIRAEVWCDLCGVPSAETVTYVAEEAGATPSVLYQLTYCETCDDR
jgi:hypothetical protein